MKKKSQRRSDDDDLDRRLNSLNDRSWELVFLKDDPDDALETRGDSFQQWMAKSLAEFDADKVVRSKEPPPGPRQRMKPAKAQWNTSAVLDLHGFNREEALRRVDYFISELRREGDRWALVIVGKGHHSEGGQAILRDETERFLMDLRKKGLIVDWFWDQKVKNKSGSILVCIRV